MLPCCKLHRVCLISMCTILVGILFSSLFVCLLAGQNEEKVVSGFLTIKFGKLISYGGVDLIKFLQVI